MTHLIGTHSGSFHADDVLAVAMWRAFVDPGARVVRTRNQRVLEFCDVVVDVGSIFDRANRRFDHHQQTYSGDRSSAGMVLDHLQENGRVPPELAQSIRAQLVNYVDAVDIGERSPDGDVPCFSSIVGTMTNDLGDGSDFDDRFEQAAQFAQRYVEGIRAGYQQNQKAREAVQKAMSTAVEQGRRFLEFDTYIPWKPSYFALGGADHPTDFVLFPSADRDWRVVAIPPEPGSFENKVPLPAAWAGLSDGELERACGIEGAKFCHKNRFIAVFRTESGARRAIEMALAEPSAAQNQ